MAVRSGVHVRVGGIVQGVGFRPWVAALASELDLVGRVWNDEAGVVVEAFGDPDRLDALVRRLRRPDLPTASVERVEEGPLDGPSPHAFAIAASRPTAPTAPAPPRLALAPDLATCDDCLRDLADPGDRRHGYPFVTCARCGPRYSIARALPWDRERTSMAGFAACDACRAEYEDPHDRRRHAETIACPACGPTLVAHEPSGRIVCRGDEALARALEVLRAGGVVAVQGVGGFHLACDAGREAAVSTLRKRKRRERKPFAVMVRDAAEAQRLARLDPPELELLRSPERPIVLVPRRPGAELAEDLAPGSDRLGLLLPYTPLHRLLLDRFGGALVMTSGNRSGEPIAHRLDDALARLGDLADLLLCHDRAIEGPCDDSVACVAAGAPLVLRRSRGFVPRALRLARPVREPVLGCGAQMNVAACIVVEDRAFFTPHCGDLESPEAVERFAKSVERLERLLGLRPTVVAHDLHPHYATTRWALARAGARRVAVQHHHAHLASCLAENGAMGAALGLVYDGTGHGSDGSAWGGELLRGDADGFERVATFRPVALAGGARAITEVWRLALALLEDAFDGDPPLDRLPLFAALDPTRRDGVRSLVRTGVACVPAHGVGRYFDAVGALALARPEADFQGEVALAWNFAAGDEPAAPYPFRLDRDRDPWEIDLRPGVRELVADLLGGAPVGLLSARFHETLAEASAAAVRAADPGGTLPVALGGGCFQNGRLAERTTWRLRALGAGRVLRHREVPPGDGGLALGQALVADAILRREGREQRESG